MARQRGRLEPAARMLKRRSADRKSTRLNSSHGYISYAVFCLKKKKKNKQEMYVGLSISGVNEIRIRRRNRLYEVPLHTKHDGMKLGDASLRGDCRYVIRLRV